MDHPDDSGASQVPKETDVAKQPSPTRASAAPRPRTVAPGGTRTENPVEPKNLFLFRQGGDVDLAPVGNKDIIFTAKLEGRLGIFYERAHTNPIPTPVTVNTPRIGNCAYLTLREVITRALRSREYETVVDANQLAQQLAIGVTVMTYCKLRSVNYLNPDLMERYLLKPVVPQPFEVPEPYALAISQLGAIKVSGLRDETYLTPTIPADGVSKYGLPNNARWTPSKYCQAVEQAKKIGIRFGSVDLSVKMGSSWWLLQPHVDDDFFELRCLIPEENFTEQTAMLRNLFSINDAGGYQADIVDLAPLGNTNFGVMCRNPQDREHIAIYYAVIKEADIMWSLA